MSTMISPLELGTAIKERAEYLAHHAIINVDELLKALAKPQSSAEAIQNIHLLQRLYLAHVLGVAGHPAILEALNDEEHFPTWKDFASLEMGETRHKRIGELMYKGNPTLSPALFRMSDYSRGIAEYTLECFVRDGNEVDPWIRDPWFDRRLLNCLTEDQAKQFATLAADCYNNAARMITLVANHNSITVSEPKPAKNIMDAYSAQLAIADKTDKSTMFYTSTRLPTPQSAAMDNMSFERLKEKFCEMTEADYIKIDQAQKFAIMKFNAGSILHFTNDDGTDLSMDITPARFANSLVAKNVPGSEFFSAPIRESVNGKIVAKGRFTPFDDDRVVENITMEFENGRVVKYNADKGLEHLETLIETDEGSHYIGEIGIGTNPFLQEHVTNALMVEKIGGSFHVALGGAYEYTEYMGEPVMMDNGNRSKVHCDLTTMLVNKGGMITLDGEVLMRNGKWLAPELSYLNAA